MKNEKKHDSLSLFLFLIDAAELSKFIKGIKCIEIIIDLTYNFKK